MAPWRAKCIAEGDGRIHRITLFADHDTMTWSDVVGTWKSTPGFASWFSALLADTPFKAFFWETPPLLSSGWTQPFQCVLVDSPALATVIASPGVFAQHFSNTGAVSGFGNLGGDAYLIAPRPDGTDGGYPHLATFLRNAPATSTCSLWRVLAMAIEKRVGTRPLWCSTSGLGVHWLHVRLDSYPKYYTYPPYRLPPSGAGK